MYQVLQRDFKMDTKITQARKRIVKFEVDVLSQPPGLLVDLNILKGDMDTNILTNVLANLLARAVCGLDRKDTNDALLNYMKYVRMLIEEFHAQIDAATAVVEESKDITTANKIIIN